jgi:hypothetical protein
MRTAFTNACTPRASQPSTFDGWAPAIIVPPWPRNTCDLDGPQAWDCGKQRERRLHERMHAARVAAVNVRRLGACNYRAAVAWSRWSAPLPST